MGNICSRSANKSTADNFTGPGRRLGDSGGAGGPSTSSTTAAATRKTKPTQPVPASVVTTSPGRTLTDGSNVVNDSDPRAAAARAAEERAKPKQGGKLTAQLNAQKNKTAKQHLADESEAAINARNADENAKNRAWN